MDIITSKGKDAGYREYLQTIESDMDLELIQLINKNLDRVYTEFNRLNRQISELKVDYDKMSDQLSRDRLDD